MNILYDDGKLKTVLMDSISYVTDQNRGNIIISGSHGGTSSARYAITDKVGAVFFNDAGVGKNAAGIKGLQQLQETNIIAVAVSHETAEIGNAEDTYENGIVSHVNGLAEKAGIRPDISVADAVNILRSYLI
jgi:hypothetical protein